MSPEGYTPSRMLDVDINDISLPASQTRKFFDPTAMDELQASIQRYGVLQPVIVANGENGKFVLVSGERRYQACLAAQLPAIPAIVTDGNPEEISIVENLLRQDLTAIEEAEAVNALKTAHSYQLSDLCSILGKADSTISDILVLNKLPDKVKDDCRNDPKTARGILVLIAKQKNHTEMQEMYDRYKTRGLTRGEIITKQRPVKKADDGPVDFSFVDLCTKRLEALEAMRVDPNRVADLVEGLTKLRSAAYQKLKALKAEPANQSNPAT